MAAGPLQVAESQVSTRFGRLKQQVNPSWADDFPEPVTPVVILSTLHALHNWATLQSIDHFHFNAPPPLVLPSPPLLVPLELPLEVRSCTWPANLLGLVLLHPDDPIHPDDVPANDLPSPLLCLFPEDHLPSKFPADMEYGPVVYELDVTYLVFLCVTVHMGSLKHHFTLLFDSMITEFACAWVPHCELVGEAGGPACPPACVNSQGQMHQQAGQMRAGSTGVASGRTEGWIQGSRGWKDGASGQSQMCMIETGLLKAIELWNTPWPLFKTSSQVKDVQHIDEKFTCVDSDVLQYHRKNRALLVELKIPFGNIFSVKDEEQVELVDQHHKQVVV
ncbi:hypothetical protein DFH08DRAFT_812596 [Mycena albidolilacea]|uniref:Uncharacterized protein n=1 Tax=Mycena albidolilacea TaxID=1033008 RepID=A0AAD6ZTQ6_9AGAR|nr:hypothetical protein DFH08DRAFT_812596 [Mycena albidolilacea]